MRLHAGSVNALTSNVQVPLQQGAHHWGMQREPNTPADRVRWAVDQSGLGLEVIAARIGCSHAALSFWQTGKTNLHNVKVGLLLEFCKVTGASLQWLLTGDGPRLTHYARPGQEAPLVSAARHIVQDLGPSVAATAFRLLSALEPPPEKAAPDV